MKRLLAIAVAIPICGAIIPKMADAVTECQSRESCMAKILVGDCCCPTDEKGYTCPSGWTYDKLKKICKRTSTDTTLYSSTTGYYKKTYGTCEGTQIDCYEYSSTFKNGCYCRNN